MATTTTKNRRAGQQLGLVRAMVIVGSVAASLVGTRLLAVNDAQETAVATPQPAAIIIEPPAAAPARNEALLIELPPIPQAISPAVQPVTRTRSSR